MERYVALILLFDHTCLYVSYNSLPSKSSDATDSDSWDEESQFSSPRLQPFAKMKSSDPFPPHLSLDDLQPKTSKPLSVAKSINEQVPLNIALKFLKIGQISFFICIERKTSCGNG